MSLPLQLGESILCHASEPRGIYAPRKVPFGVPFPLTVFLRIYPAKSAAYARRFRLGDMEKAGIDLQVISHAPPGGQRLHPETALAACREANDALATIASVAPDGFAGFATLPQAHPVSAAEELQRCFGELGFAGATMFGSTGGRFLESLRCTPGQSIPHPLARPWRRSGWRDTMPQSCAGPISNAATTSA